MFPAQHYTNKFVHASYLVQPGRGSSRRCTRKKHRRDANVVLITMQGDGNSRANMLLANGSLAPVQHDHDERDTDDTGHTTLMKMFVYRRGDQNPT